MAAYSNGGRRVLPNIAGLNAVGPASFDLGVAQQEGYGIDAGLDADLDMFTNAQFFDFDMGHVADPSPIDSIAYTTTTPPKPGNAFVPSTDLQYRDFGGLRQRSDAQNIRPRSAYASPPQLSPTAISPGASPAAYAPHFGGKRKADSAELEATSTPGSSDDASRAAAEEDKRRRNTAASARFRVKKKQREQALEKTAKDMTDRVSYLENRVGELEMENKLLKNLIVGEGRKAPKDDAGPPARLADPARQGEQAEREPPIKADFDV